MKDQATKEAQVMAQAMKEDNIRSTSSHPCTFNSFSLLKSFLSKTTQGWLRSIDQFSSILLDFSVLFDAIGITFSSFYFPHLSFRNTFPSSLTDWSSWNLFVGSSLLIAQALDSSSVIVTLILSLRAISWLMTLISSSAMILLNSLDLYKLNWLLLHVDPTDAFHRFLSIST